MPTAEHLRGAERALDPHGVRGKTRSERNPVLMRQHGGAQARHVTLPSWADQWSPSTPSCYLLWGQLLLTKANAVLKQLRAGRVALEVRRALRAHCCRRRRCMPPPAAAAAQLHCRQTLLAGAGKQAEAHLQVT